MTDWLIVIFFGVALLIGIYFTWVLLRAEMAGPPKAPPDADDYGFGSHSGGTKPHIHHG